MPHPFPQTQNRDGGWPYREGCSWTEPTVYAMLAQYAAGPSADSLERGFAWLRAVQRPDGGWPPLAAVPESTWVTALVALLPPERLGRAAWGRAIDWLLHRTGQESTFLHRLILRLRGGEAGDSLEHHGWPWYPGTAAWVVPTAVSVLALGRAQCRQPSGAIAERLASGRRFLLSRRCPDGGWNHGSVRILNQDGRSYPETTGVALLACAKAAGDELAASCATARKHLAEARSADAVSWLKMALRAHGCLPADLARREVPARDVREAALSILAAAGRNLLLEES